MNRASLWSATWSHGPRSRGLSRLLPCLKSCVLFKDGTMDAKGVDAKKAHIKHFITNGNCEFPEWIWGFDAFLDANPQSVKGYPMVLKALYDGDIAQEADLLRHYRSEKDTPGFEAAAKAAAPFLKWLETADDDDSGSG